LRRFHRDRRLGGAKAKPPEQKVVRENMVFLQFHGVGTARAVRVYKTYGDQAAERVREDPYRLALDIHDKLLQVVTERTPRRFGLHPIEDVQVLTPMNRGRLGARSLNVELQQRLNPSSQTRLTRFGWTYAPGDKVIQTANNCDKDVFNGDIGRVVKIDEAMSWGSVRNLRHMQRSLLLVRNVLQQADVPDGVTECLDEVTAIMDETLEALARGELGSTTDDKGAASSPSSPTKRPPGVSARHTPAITALGSFIQCSAALETRHRTRRRTAAIAHPSHGRPAREPWPPPPSLRLRRRRRPCSRPRPT
jgi:hypothetical protein